jgi:hypothetical protein
MSHHRPSGLGYDQQYTYSQLPTAHPWNSTPQTWITSGERTYARWAQNQVNYFQAGTGLRPCTTNVHDTPTQYPNSYRYDHKYPTLSQYSLYPVNS